MPKLRISNPNFRYTPSAKTDIGAKIRSVLRKIKKAAAAEKARPAKVTPIKRKAVAG